MNADHIDSSYFKVQIHDTEYDGHDAKVIAGSTAIPYNLALKNLPNQLNNTVKVPTVFHFIMHASKICLLQNVNFDLILSHFTKIIQP